MTINIHAIDHGILVNAEESRTAAQCINKEGEERFVIAAKGFVLIINPSTDETRQLFFPEKYVEYPFASFSSEEGFFYTGAGKMLMVIDPFKERIIDYKWIENGDEIFGFSFAEHSYGHMFFTSYPRCHLLQYNLKTKTLIDHGSMDETEKYPASVAVDRHGWVYIGIGTERKNVIAYHPETKEKRSLVPCHQRTRGAGHVYKGEDGSVYGHWEARDLKDVNDSSQWWVLLDGYGQQVQNVSPSLYSGNGFNRIHRNAQASYKVLEHNLAEGFLVVKKEQEKEKRIEFSYQSEGATLSTLFSIRGQHIYGTSMHPLHLFGFDLESNVVRNYGGSVIENGGGGNIVAYAVQGKKMFGFAYAGGKIYEFNLEQPIYYTEKSRNPKLISEHKWIHRPRCAISHPDGVNIIWGGFPDYGLTGGGLGIYNVNTRENKVISHTSIVPNQSTVCLGVFRSGDILGGTSIETPGGASSNEKEGKLYLFDWENKEVIYSINAVPGSKEISQLFIDQQGMAHGLTMEGIYFVFDSCKREVLYKKDVSRFGAPVRNSFVLNENNTALYCLLSRAIMKINLNESPLTEPILSLQLMQRATSGIVYYKGSIYYGSGSHLISVKVQD
ncbi:hypothetical protein KHA94_15565 [Bacillus sp. FJAT-49705]|uniref:Uncharacterized protein n=1 Tax=Cytobacillus citreus TaxID=2833586 RepID=A0ABS5NUU6_9BACI|nr:hypothetical protein [Cytobacillus citreus]MBS4191607.1 hypothetical protein [Cytobacillus citreus]